MSEQENLLKLREGYRAYARGEVEKMSHLLADDVEWVEPQVTGLPGSGTHRGRDAVLEQVFGPLEDTWEYFKVDVEEFHLDGETIIVLGKMTACGKATGEEVTVPCAQVFKFSDGQIHRCVNYCDGFPLARSAGIESTAAEAAGARA